MKYSKWNILLFRICIWIFKLIGLAPLKLIIKFDNRNSVKNFNIFLTYSVFGVVYNIILIFYFLIIMFVIMFSPSSTNESKKAIINQMLANIILIIRNSATIIILLIYIFYRRKIVMIVNRIIQLNNELMGKFTNFYYQQNREFYEIFIFIIYIIHNIVLLVIQLLLNNKLYGVTVALPAAFILGSCTIQYALLLNTIKNRLYNLNESIVLLVNCISDNRQINIMDIEDFNSTLKTFRMIKIWQSILSESSHEISKFFSWPALLSIFYYCIELINNLYYLNTILFQSKESESISLLNGYLWTIECLFPLIILVKSVTEITREVCIL